MVHRCDLRFFSLVLLAIPALGWGQGRPPTVDPTFGLSKFRMNEAKPLAPDAYWIWGATTANDQTLLFRRDFELSSVPAHAKLFITVDDDFSLWVNGHPIGADQPKTGDEAWSTVQGFDISSALVKGANTIAVKAHNVGGPAGLLARLEFGGKPYLFSDTSWLVATAHGPITDTAPNASATNDTPEWVKPTFVDRNWDPATYMSALGGGAWGSRLAGWPVRISSEAGYLAHLDIFPTRFSYAPDVDHLAWRPIPASGRFARPDNQQQGEPWRIILDFGKELTGRIVVSRASGDDTALNVGTGESEGEAIEKPYTSVSGTEPSLSGPFTAFRYAVISVPGNVAEAKFDAKLDHLFYPVKYRGSFDCSDPLLTRIWYTGAYTAHLCMQEDIWDAPKRDRAKWMGDLHVSGEVINNVFADRFLMEQTMSRLRAEAQQGRSSIELPGQNVNGIPGYSCAWICGLADFYRHSGDLAYLKSQHEALITMLGFLKGELDADGVFANKHGEWPFSDWSPGFDGDMPPARAATHLFLTRAVHESIFLFRDLGDAENAQRMGEWESQLTTVAQQKLLDPSGTFGDRLQENAMAIFSGVATDAQRAQIYDRIFRDGSPAWEQVVSPYYGNYVLAAMGACGHTAEALAWMRRNWGGMLAEGATSFWEGYDPRWDKHNFHAHLQADDGTGYFVSLSHGWSAGPTNFLTEQVLGVRSTGGGFKTCSIRPDLGGLSWAEGVVPTPSGDLKARVDQMGSGMRVRLKVPKGVEATVGGDGMRVSVDGKEFVAGPVAVREGSHVILIQTGESAGNG